MQIRILLLLLTLVLARPKGVFASGFHITSIGGVETNGIQYGKFWHTSSKPTIRGASLPSEEIKITIDGQTYTINADSAGDWVFTPVDPLPEGGHSLVIECQGSTIIFTLTIGTGNVDYAAVGRGGSGGGTLPTVGFILPTTLLAGIGGGLTLAGKKLLKN